MAQVFLSYPSEKRDTVDRLANAIIGAGHEVWLDRLQIRIGDSIVERVQRGLYDSPYLVLCCFDIGLTPWMDREWMSTLARQLSGVDVHILPARFQGGTPPPILCDILFADFASDWDSAVADLLSALA
jgi:hypothetical protein